MDSLNKLFDFAARCVIALRGLVPPYRFGGVGLETGMRTGTFTFALAVATMTAVVGTRMAAGYYVIDLTPGGATGAIAIGIWEDQVVGSAVVPTISAWTWNTTTLSSVNLHATGDSSQANGVSAEGQVGSVTIGSHGHAAMWLGTSASYVPLNDTGYTGESSATGISSGIVVGSGVSDTTSLSQALMWTNPGNATVAPAALLTPGNFAGTPYAGSSAVGINGTRVAGFATVGDPVNLNHAAAWNISNLGSVVFTDLHPVGFTDSQAIGVSGNEVVGFGSEVAGTMHALVWTMVGDTVGGMVDLNPAGFDSSAAGGTNGVNQVGYAVGADGEPHAMLWSGTAGSAVDLSVYLPSGYLWSEALGISTNGEIVGIAVDGDLGMHAVVWAPEPGSLALLGIGAVGLMRRRR